MASGRAPALLLQFEDALEDFTRTLLPIERDKFRFTTVAEVNSEIERIQKEQERKHLLRGLKRITPFVEGLTRYSAVIEQFVNINPGILAPLWGPLKLILQVSSNMRKPFDVIIDALAKIGRCLPRFEMFAALFGQSPRISQVLVWLYSDILDFYSEVLKFFRKKPSEQFFSALWSRFGDHFEHLLNRLESHANLVDVEASAADINEAYRFRAEACKEFFLAAKEREKHMFEEMAAWLAPLSFESDLQRCQDIIKSYPNPGEWLLDNSKFDAWRATTANSVLWLSGIPGSGKTILSYVVWDLMENRNKSLNTVTLAFFMSDRSRGLHSAVSVLRTLAYYIISEDPALLPFFMELQGTMLGKQGAKTRKSLEDLVDHLISNSGLKRVYLILDGIDEIDEKERTALIDFFLDISRRHSNLFSILVSGREEWDIKAKLSKYPRIVANEHNGGEIELYVETERQALVDTFYPYLSTDEAKDLLQPLPARSNGMFLFARLVIYSLKQQTSLAQVRLAANNLPKGLHEAYSRIIQRLNRDDQDQRKIALSILQYLLCSRISPRLIEIKHALIIEVGATGFDRDRLLIKGLDELCGPILEIRENVVSFVHFSAKEYLQLHESGLDLQLSLAEHAMATRCLAYLNFSCFGEGLTSQAIANSLEQGEYLWLEYVERYWLDHVKAASKENGDHNQTLEHLVRSFVDRWKRPNGDDLQNWGQNISLGFTCFKDRSPDVYKALSRAALYRCQSRVLETSDDPFILSDFSRTIRQHLETVVLSKCPTDQSLVKLHEFYGFRLFRCTESACSRFLYGFLTPSERKAHGKVHERPFRCSEPSCEYSHWGFSSSSALSKHAERHRKIEFTTTAMSKLRIDNTSVPAVSIDTSQAQTTVDTLYNAIIADDVGIVRHLYSEDQGLFACNEPRNPLLRTAIKNKSIKTLRWLLGQGIEDVDQAHVSSVDDRNAPGGLLEFAVRQRATTEIINLLHEFGEHANSHSLNFAIRSNFPEIVELLLLECRADPNELVYSDRIYTTPLIEAVAISYEMTHLLLEYGANIQDAENPRIITQSALLLAVTTLQPDVVKLLLDRGANPDITSSGRSIPLAVAMITGRGKIDRVNNLLCVKFLLEAGANPQHSQSRKPLGAYKILSHLPQYVGATWEELVEANKHKVPFSSQPPVGATTK